MSLHPVNVHFPIYPVKTLPTLTDDFMYLGWYHRKYPVWRRGTFLLGIDYPNKSNRSTPNLNRYRVWRENCKTGQVTEYIMETDDWSKIARYFNI